MKQVRSRTRITQGATSVGAVAVDLRISEVVDIPHPVVSALCPLDVFTEIRPQRG